MTKTNKTTKKAAGIQTGLQSEVINLLEKKPHTHRQLCDALVLPGESTKPITDALYRLSSNRIAIKGDDGYIRLITPTTQAQPEVAQNTGRQPSESDENSAGGVMASGLSRAEGPTESPPEVETPLGEEANDDLPDILPELQALKDENLALRLEMDGLKAELGDALLSANDYAGRTDSLQQQFSGQGNVLRIAHELLTAAGMATGGCITSRLKQLIDKLDAAKQEAKDHANSAENLRNVNRAMDAVFSDLHAIFAEHGIKQGHLKDRLKDLIYSQPDNPVQGYIVTDLHQLHDTEQEAVDFASAEARPDSTVLIAAVVRRGTVPPIAVQWINPQQAEVSHV